MTQVEKLLSSLLTCPKSFRFRDFVRIMEYLGYEMDQKGATSGSRVRFYRRRDGRMFIMHSPHPSNEMNAAAVRACVAFLRKEGIS